MRPNFIFWVSALVRIVLVAVLGLICAYFMGMTLALLVVIAGLLLLIYVQLNYLFKLSLWLENPHSAKLPDGWGEWTEIFARLYKLRRNDEKNQAELAEWLSRFRQAMTQLPDGVVIMDEVLFLEWCNPIAQSHLGLNLEKDKGMRITNLVRKPEFIDYLMLARFETPLSMTVGNRKLLVHIIPFENRRQILVTQDVTETERIDQMRRDFIANASHELRTPLTVINGFLEIAASQPHLDPATRHSHLQLMVSQGSRMQRLIEDMLELSRLESGDSHKNFAPIHMRRLLHDVCKEAQALSSGRHSIVLSDEGPNIMGCFEEIRSAVTNLLTNAIRYTPEGGKIHITWLQDKEGPKLIVEDNGIGISPEHISRLTERFYRVDKSRSRETEGTGLGLAIVKHILLRHEAQIYIESTPNVGSVFSIHFSSKNSLPVQS